MPLAASGWRGAWDWTRFGIFAAASSVVTCWGFMLALVVAGHSAVLMVAFFAVQMLESNARFRHGDVLGTAALAAAALVVIA